MRLAGRPGPGPVPSRPTRTRSPWASRLPLWLLVLLPLLLHPAAAASRPRNPLRAVARVDDAVLHARDGRVHAGSAFQLALTLTAADGSGSARVPLRFRLRPDHDVLADRAAVHHADADGRVVAVEPIDRRAHRVFHGEVFVGSGGGDGWTPAGWASVYVHADGARPVVEGAFVLAGDPHHIQTRRHYRETGVDGDPVLDGRPGEDDDESMVVWRDSDLVADADVVRRDGRDPARRAGCSADALRFNRDDRHPVYTGLADLSTLSALSALAPRQIDGGGNPGGGNAAGVDLTSTIGSTAGCPTARKVALLGVAADCGYVAAFADKAAASANIVQQVSAASRAFEAAFNVSLGIQDLLLPDRSCPSDAAAAASATPWNAACERNRTLADRLNLFSAWRGASAANDTNAFWMLLSTCATDDAVGLAWLGQLCVPGAQASGAETVAAASVVVRTSTEWQVMAHETGHTFGAVHDCTSQTCSDGTATQQQCCPLRADACSAAGQFLMNPSTGAGIAQFSPCTQGSVCAALGRNSVQSACLASNRGVVTVAGSACGNGIVEDGEECDCGGPAGCAASGAGSGSGARCCDPATCRFTPGALCDPTNDECCTAACQLAAAGTVCRASTGPCDPAETCSGASVSCPADATAPDGTACDDDALSPPSSASGLRCAAGQCTSRDRQCQTLMGALAGSNDTYACSARGCQLSCASPALGAGRCLVLDQNFLDGTPCQGGGRCANGRCDGVSATKEVAEAFRHNLDIVVPVAVVVGLLVLAAVASCVRAAVLRRRRQSRRRALVRAGMPPPPKPANPEKKPNGRAAPRWAFWRRRPDRPAAAATTTIPMQSISGPDAPPVPPPVPPPVWAPSFQSPRFA